MKIYMVSHFYDNGEHYEDRQEYENHEFYSTYQKAKDKFWASVIGDYEGKFVLTEIELDTQEKEVLEESVWLECKPYYNEEWQGDHEPDYEDYDCSPDPTDSYKEYWRWEEQYPDYDEIPEEEDKAWRQYVTTPGTNYQEWEECEKEIKERKNAILLDELNSLLVELLK